MNVYEATLAHQEAGAFAVEMEVVPEQVAEAISKKNGNACNFDG